MSLAMTELSVRCELINYMGLPDRAQTDPSGLCLLIADFGQWN